jgi:hypothetical protein
MWEPPFDLAQPGWRNSTEPLCTERFGGVWARVWSDDQAVFALVSASCNVLAGIGCAGAGTTLYQNSGNGWVPLKTWIPAAATSGGGPTELAGFVGGPLIVYPDECGISFVDRAGSAQCAWQNTAVEYISSVFATPNGNAFALVGKQLWSYSNTWSLVWTLPADSPEATVVRASGDSAVIAGYTQLALRGSSSGNFAPLPAVPAGDYTSAWVFGSNDIWLANSFGHLVHFNGSTWQIIDTRTDAGIDGLWGSPDGTLYFYSQRAFGRWNGQKVEVFAQATLAQWSLFNFTHIWGNSSNEVFLGAIQKDFRDYECSGVFSIWFDGSQFHVF